MRPAMFRWNTDDWFRIFVEGKDAKRFLHGMLTNDIRALGDSAGLVAAMVSAQGKTLALMHVYQLHSEKFLLVTHAITGESLLDYLKRHVILEDVTINKVPEHWVQLGVYGNAAKFLLKEIAPAKPDKIVQRGSQDKPFLVMVTEEWGPGHFWIMGDFETVNTAFLNQVGSSTMQSREISQQEAESHRIASGTPYYGIEINEDRLPLEVGLEHIVSFNKGCYVGQEVLNRLHSKDLLSRTLIGMQFSTPDTMGTFVGSLLSHESRNQAGVICSYSLSNDFGPIGLAYVHRSVSHIGSVFKFQPIGYDEPVYSMMLPLPFRSTADMEFSDRS